MKFILLVLLSIYCATTFAMFCPSNLNQIELGDTLQQVQAACGKPSNQKNFKKASAQPQEWNYFLKLNPQTEGTMKVTFAFIDNAVVNMSVNGIGVGATSICGSNIALGANMQTIEAACGKPVSITGLNNVPGEQGEPAPDVSEWKYDVGPPNTLVFENGILKERK